MVMHNGKLTRKNSRILSLYNRKQNEMDGGTDSSLAGHKGTLVDITKQADCLAN